MDEARRALAAKLHARDTSMSFLRSPFDPFGRSEIGTRTGRGCDIFRPWLEFRRSSLGGESEKVLSLVLHPSMSARVDERGAPLNRYCFLRRRLRVRRRLDAGRRRSAATTDASFFPLALSRPPSPLPSILFSSASSCRGAAAAPPLTKVKTHEISICPRS